MATNNHRIKLFIAEEQQILREAYGAFFASHTSVELVGSSGDTNTQSMISALSELRPDVMVLGVKSLKPAVVKKLEEIRKSNPNVAIVLLSAFYDVKGTKALREFAGNTAGGCAYLLKHNIDTVEQLTQIVQSVTEGRVIVDPLVMEGLVTSTDANSVLLKELSPRELEVLSWIAKGYRNNTIAEVLGLDPKTIERHINNIYSKLGSAESKHSRVHAVMLYLKAIGLLHAQDFADGG